MLKSLLIVLAFKCIHSKYVLAFRVLRVKSNRLGSIINCGRLEFFPILRIRRVQGRIIKRSCHFGIFRSGKSRFSAGNRKSVLRIFKTFKSRIDISTVQGRFTLLNKIVYGCDFRLKPGIFSGKLIFLCLSRRLLFFTLLLGRFCNRLLLFLLRF